MEGGQGDSIVLEEEIDPNYEPTEKEVIEYATWLGMDLEAEKDLFWIAREGLKAPLPENWKPCKTTDTEEIYYFNFATGQSTWDHPCDEFYRNLYEEHKKKRQSGGGQDMDEKKRKEKEDVAELLGRGKSGKKKKAAAKADPLGGGGGPPGLLKTSSLEMKPLSKLGSLGPVVSGGPGPGGLKPVGSLGRMRAGVGGAKSAACDEDGEDAADDVLEVPKALSKPPLGGLFTKKPFPTTTPSSLLSSASLCRGAESKAELDGLSTEFEGKKEALMEQHAKALHDLESQHESEVAALKSKLQQQLEETRDEEEVKLKQLKRDFDKKTNDLENQFDRDENALLRQRKEKLKKLETGMENALSLKKQELDRDHRADIDKLQARHDAKLREMKDEFASDERKLGDKLQAELGEKTEALAAAAKLKAEVDRLTSARESLEQQLRDCRLENEQLTTDKRAIEQKSKQAEQTIKDLRREVAESEAAAAEQKDRHNEGDGGRGSGSGGGGNGNATGQSGEAECNRCQETLAQAEKWRKEAEEAQRECVACRDEVEALHKELASAADSFKTHERDMQQEHADAIENKEEEIRSLRDIEDTLRGEIKTAREREAELEATVKRLEAAARTSSDANSVSPQPSSPPARSEQDVKAIDELQRLFEGAREELSALKGEHSDLQDQLAVLATTNAQIKEQLLKESKEKKHLREQLDGVEGEVRDLKAAAVDSSQLQATQQHGTQEELQLQLEQREQEHNRRVAELQSQLDASSASEKDREAACEMLRSQLLALESEKRAALADVERLTNEKRRLEAEKSAITAQLQVARDAQAARQSESANAATEDARARLDDKTRELDALLVSFKGASAEKDHLETRVVELNGEIEALQGQVQRLELASDNERSRCARVEADKNALALRLRETEESADSQVQRARALANEVADLKAQLGKSKLKEQGTADRLQQFTDEKSELELALQNQQRDLEGITRELRLKSSELEEKQAQNRELHADSDVLQEQIADLKGNVAELRARLQAATASATGGGGSGAAGAAGGAQRTETALLREQVSEYEGKLDALVREKAQLTEKVRALTQKGIESEFSMRSAAMEKEQAAAELEAASAELTKWKMKAERAVKDVEALGATARELESDKELLETSVRRLTDQTNELSQAKLLVEKAKKALEGEVGSLYVAVEVAEAARRSVAVEQQALQSKTKRLESELASATRQIQTLQDAKTALETSAAQQGQELVSLQSKIRLLRSENAEIAAGAKETEADLSRNGDAARQLEEQLAASQLQYKRERDEREALAKQLQSLQSARDELESTVTSLRRRAESAESRWKEHEDSSSRDDLTTKRKLQQAEMEKDTLARGKERAETQLKALEKELSSRTEALDGSKAELESLQARLKSVLKEHEEVRAMLLTASLANASSGAGRHQQGATGAAPSSGANIPADAMLVKLQLADVNRSELEVHLADVASQLEAANRRCTLLDARCRDQSIDIESFHVEIASLRSASQQMHLSALETLSFVERLEYEHKKRILKSDFTDQLRDFQEREEVALARRKARLRAQYERQLDELVAEMEKRKQHRVEQEEAAAQQLLDHLRRERDARREELQLQIRKELHEFERELLERKNRELDVISKAVEQEEAQLAFRLREARQAAREEELARQDDENQPTMTGPSSSLMAFTEARATPKSPTMCAEPAGHAWSSQDDAGAVKPGKLRGGKRSELSRSARHTATPAKTRRSSPSKRVDRSRRRTKRASKEYRQWKQRVGREHALLTQAKALLARQRQELSTSARQLRKSASEWRRGSHGARDNQIQQQMKEMLDESTADWNERKAKLAEREGWIKDRQRKLSRMEHAVEKLRSGIHADPRRHRSNNRRRSLYCDDDSDANSGGDSNSDDESDSVDGLSQSEGDLGDVLAKLRQLDSELAFDSSDWSEDALVGGVSSEWDNGVNVNTRGESAGVVSRSVGAIYCPTTYSPRYQVPDTSLAGASHRYSLAPFSTGIGLRRKTTPTVLQSSAANAASDTSRWLFSGPRSSFPSQRVASVGARPMTSNERRLAERTAVYQRQISQWARDREKMHHAASKHASWLSGLCEELKEYSASRHDRISDNEGVPASSE